jgi:hypothetical protein
VGKLFDGDRRKVAPLAADDASFFGEHLGLLLRG